MDRKHGALALPPSKDALHIGVCLKHSDGTFRQFTFQLDSGSSYTQIDLDTAVGLGLLGHTSLIGSSAVANGQRKIDYLCNGTIQVLGVEASLVLKVSPGQPCLLGLDAMVLFGFEINMVPTPPLNTPRFSIAAAPFPIADVALRFRWLHFDAIMTQLRINSQDLVTFDKLPTPEQAHQELVRLGLTNHVVDLGMACFSLLIPRAHAPVYL